MLLSVIMPAYNDGNYMDKAISSVYGQTFQDFELIVVNDGSTDQTDRVCRKWQSKHPNFVYITQENRGPSVARAVGIQAARGKYCMFLDADDWFCAKDAFERLVNRMEERGVDVLQFLVEKNKFGKSGSVSGTSGEKSIEEFWSQDCSTLLGGETKDISPYICDKIYRTDIFKAVVTDHKVERICIFDYIYLNLLFFARSEVKRMAWEPWLCYSWRQYSGAIFRCDESLLEDYEVLKALQLATIEKMGLPKSYLKQCHVETAYLFGSACWKAGQHRKVTVDLLKQLYQYPMVQGAITYFEENPGGLWDVIWNFMNTGEEKLARDAARYSKNWKAKGKGLYISLFCKK